MMDRRHRVPRITLRDLALIFRLLVLAAAAVELERDAQTRERWKERL